MEGACFTDPGGEHKDSLWCHLKEATENMSCSVFQGSSGCKQRRLPKGGGGPSILDIGPHLKKTAGLSQWALVHLAWQGPYLLASDRSPWEAKGHMGADVTLWQC